MIPLKVSGLTKRYESFTLNGVSFELCSGKITGFIGRNGAGKSTTLKSIFGLVHPDEGEVEFFGLPFSQHELEIKARVGFVVGGEGYYANRRLKTITNITRRFYDSWDEQAYRRYIELFALDERKTAAQLSSGMRVKYALALALSHNAQLLVLDEPTSGLDPVSRDELMDIFMQLCDEGISILFSTHITSDLESCANDIIYIKEGQLIAQGSMADFIADYQVVQLPERSDDARLIGCKRAREGYTALVKSADAKQFSQPRPATLEEIMLHIEREEI